MTPVRDRTPEISLRRLEELFDELEALGTRIVRLVGGEPFVRRDIGEIISRTAGRSFWTSVLTNGMLVSRRQVEEMARAGVRSVAFSVDGPTARIHNRSRGSSHAFRRLLETSRLCRSHGLPCRMMTALTTGVLPHLKELVEFADEHDFELVNLILLIRSSRTCQDEATFPLYRDWARAAVDLSHHLARRSPRCRVAWLFPHEDAVPRELYRALRDASCLSLLEEVWGIDPTGYDPDSDDGTSICLAGHDSVTILPNGDVYGCELMRGIEGLRAGNIHERSLAEIFRSSSVFRSLRRSSTVRGCASFAPDSRDFSCGQCRAGAILLDDRGHGAPVLTRIGDGVPAAGTGG